MESGLPGRCGEKFKVLQLLREGGYGRIFLAQQEDLDRPVVVKILSPASLKEAEDVQRFLNEARITTRLSHPNIVVVIDHDVEDGIPWIAYEYLPGRNLRDALVRGAISLDGALDVGVQVAAALEEAHSKEVLHRDIKPENVVEVEPGRYKVIDFGIAKWSGDHAVHTMSGYIMGTPNYMSPELIQGKPASPRSDLYALGVLLFELVVGRQPFQADTPLAVMEKHLNEEPPTPSALRPGVPPALDEAILKALAKRPAERFQHAGEMRAFLEPMRMEISLRRLPHPPRRTRRLAETAALPTVTPQDRLSPHADEDLTARSPGAGGVGQGKRLPVGPVLKAVAAGCTLAFVLGLAVGLRLIGFHEATPEPSPIRWSPTVPAPAVDGSRRDPGHVPVGSGSMMALERDLGAIDLENPDARRSAQRRAVEHLRRVRRLGATPAERPVSRLMAQLVLENVLGEAQRLGRASGQSLEGFILEGRQDDPAMTVPVAEEYPRLVQDLADIASWYLSPRDDAEAQLLFVRAASHLADEVFDPISSSRTIDDLVATWSAADPAGWVPRQIRADVSRNRVRDGRELTIRLEALDLFETQYLGDDRGVAPAGGALKVWKVLGDKLLVCCRRAGDARRLQMTIESYERRIGRLRLPGPVAARLLTAIRATARNEQELGAAPATRTTDRAAGSVIPPAPPIRSVGSPSAAAARASPAPSSCPR